VQNLSKQVNFKTNPEVLKEAKKVLSENNQSLSSVLNAVLQTIALKKEIPVKSSEELEAEGIFLELKNEIQKGYASYNERKKISSQEMRSHFGL
jgi:antitoxin component of RelBE/YafQ-DinJ toxin-antitoxin module